MSTNGDRFPRELERLFESYRGAIGEVEPSRAFLPALWSGIEQRQRITYSFRRMASGFVTVAAAICLMMSAALWAPSQWPQFTSSTYVDVLADDYGPESFDQADSL